MLKINIQLFGGRGASSGVSAAASQQKQSKPSSLEAFRENSRQFNEALKKEENRKKYPMYGDKTQQGYIDYVKKQTNIDLTPARDTYYDNRKGFNIDTRKLKPGDLNEIKRLAQRYPGGYEVSFEDNGATRVYIAVRRSKIK